MPLWSTIDQPGFWAAWHKADTRMKTAPADITDDDIETLRFLDPELATRAGGLRIKALEPEPIPAPQPTTRAVRGSTFVTHKQLTRFAEDTAGALVEILRHQKGEIEALKTRVQELESRPHLKHCGVWRNDATYAEGHLVTHNGGLWLATMATTDPPGTPDSQWRLIVKSGLAR
jgi:hypothetical protein